MSGEKTDISRKIEIIQKMLAISQTKIAEKLGVSFATINSWKNGRSEPRARARRAVEELYLEVTGQKKIPKEKLLAQKEVFKKKAAEHKSVVREILDNPDIRDSFILKLTYHSGRMEGSTLTEPETAAILFDDAALPDKSLVEQLEAKNHQTALNYLWRWISEGGKINEKLVLKLHGILMNGVRSDAGLYRRHAVRIAGVNLPTANFLRVPELIKPVMRKAGEKSDDIINLAAEVHSQFEKIHPFSDGNGRVGRLLLNGMLSVANFAPAIIRQEQKQLYYTYLYKAQTKGDLSQLEDFLGEAILEGFEVLERKNL